MKAYSLANRFLTVIPWPAAPEEPGAGDLSSAVSRFPLVGLALGVSLVALDIFLGILFPGPVRDVLLVIALIFLTGGLHLKAVAAWGDSIGPRVFDSTSFDALGTASLAGFFFLKFAALLSLPDEGRWSALLLAPVLGRAAVAYLIASRPKEGDPKEGEPDEFDTPFSRAVSLDEGYVAAGWALGISLVLGFIWGVLVALMVGAATYGWKRYFGPGGGGAGGGSCLAAGEAMEALAFLLFSVWWGGS